MMTKPNSCTLFLVLLGLFATFGVSAADSKNPEITAQGFSAELPQKGLVGDFPRLRVRIEAADRIKELIIKERSYDVDLASTRDKFNLYLFGLEKTPRSYRDVTLNLQNYINERIETEGEYEFHILVADRNDNVVEKKIFLHAHIEAPEKESTIVEATRLLQTEYFTLQRIGTGSVEGTRLFGIDWQNIDNTNVQIRISKLEDSDSHLVVLDESDFDNLQTIDQLRQKVAGLEKTEAVVLATGSNRAAGKVFSVINGDKHYLLKITSSSAYPSDRGTIVTVKGYFKTGVTIE
jgi:hypothetical protein